MDQSGGVENSTYFWFFNPLLVFLSPISQLSQFYALLHFLEDFLLSKQVFCTGRLIQAMLIESHLSYLEFFAHDENLQSLWSAVCRDDVTVSATDL